MRTFRRNHSDAKIANARFGKPTSDVTWLIFQDGRGQQNRCYENVGTAADIAMTYCTRYIDTTWQVHEGHIYVALKQAPEITHVDIAELA
jgi:hypothetical protein